LDIRVFVSPLRMRICGSSLGGITFSSGISRRYFRAERLPDFMRGAVGYASVTVVNLAAAKIYSLPIADTMVNPNK
jgi:hypothetical protein